jgi:flagellar biogenesis protein FliO
MPAWMAWDIMGIASGMIGALLLLVLFIIIRKQLRSPKPSATKEN